MTHARYAGRIWVLVTSCLLSTVLVVGCLGAVPADAASQDSSSTSETVPVPSATQDKASQQGQETAKTNRQSDSSPVSSADAQSATAGGSQPASTPSESSDGSSAPVSGSGASSSSSVKSEVQYPVTFDLNGGDPPAPQVQMVGDGGKATRPSESPTRDGYLFDGWFNGALGYNFNNPVTKELTLSAHWTKDDPTWKMTPVKGPSRGGTQVTLTPPEFRGIRFTQFAKTGGDNTSLLALATDGHAYGWGNNKYGKLGNGNTEDLYVATPVLMPDHVSSDFTYTNLYLSQKSGFALGSDGKYYGWGDNTYGQLGNGTRTATPQLTPVEIPKPAGTPDDFAFTDFCPGLSTGVAVGSDGNLYGWGGALNTAPTIPTKYPKPSNVGDDFSYVSASSGRYFFLVLGSDGNIYSINRVLWTASGEPDPEAITVLSKPAGVGDNFTYTSKTSSGNASSYAFGSDGNLYAWGNNQNGTFGDGSTTDSSIPVKVKTPSENVTFLDVSAGITTAFALGSDGNIYGWGLNSQKRLGTGFADKIIKVPTLVQKPATAPDITYIALGTGQNETYAIGSDGLTYGWGSNGTLLGIDQSNPKPVTQPVEIVNPGQGRVSQVWFGTSPVTTTPIRNTGGTWTVITPAHRSGLVPVTVNWLWGGGEDKYYSALQYQYEPQPYYTVTFDKADGSEASQVSVSNGTQVKRPADNPTREGYEFDGWFINSTGTSYNFSTPVTSDLTLKAHWSLVKDGQWKMSPTSGPEAGGTLVTLTAPAPRGIRFSQISSGQGYAVAVGSDGRAWAWGSNQSGQLGDGTTTDQTTPIPVTKPDGVDSTFTYTQVSAGKNHVLAIGSDGNIYTWGNNEYGQLGNNSTIDQKKPTKIAEPDKVNTPITYTQVSAGDYYSLALDSTGHLYAWGLNAYGQLGNGTLTNALKPVQVNNPKETAADFTYTQVSAGQDHTLAIGYDGYAYGWGRNDSNQVYYGIRSMRTIPDPTLSPSSTPTPFIEVRAGSQFSIGLKADGTIYTWGDTAEGQLGRNCTVPFGGCSPGVIQNPDNTSGRIFYQHISAGKNFALATSIDGKVWAWGKNSSGELGNGNTNTTNKPTQVSSITASTDSENPISAGNGLSLLIDSDGNPYSWGSNTSGQLGNGSKENQNNPKPVSFPGKNTLTSFTFDGKTITTEPKPDTEDTWQFTTPEHLAATVSTNITWTNNDKPQPDADYLTYQYFHIGILPKAGGPGILLILLIGLATTTITAIHHNKHKTQTKTQHTLTL